MQSQLKDYEWQLSLQCSQKLRDAIINKLSCYARMQKTFVFNFCILNRVSLRFFFFISSSSKEMNYIPMEIIRYILLLIIKAMQLEFWKIHRIPNINCRDTLCVTQHWRFAFPYYMDHKIHCSTDGCHNMEYWESIDECSSCYKQICHSPCGQQLMILLNNGDLQCTHCECNKKI